MPAANVRRQGMGSPERGLSNTGWKPVLRHAGRQAGGQAQVTNLCYRERTRFQTACEA